MGGVDFVFVWNQISFGHLDPLVDDALYLTVGFCGYLDLPPRRVRFVPVFFAVRNCCHSDFVEDLVAFGDILEGFAAVDYGGVGFVGGVVLEHLRTFVRVVNDL